jgi:hypothetical protein
MMLSLQDRSVALDTVMVGGCLDMSPASLRLSCVDGVLVCDSADVVP